MKWNATAHFTADLRTKTKLLGVVVSSNDAALGDWNLIAFEAPLPESGITAETVLAEHGHKLVGVFPDIVAAFAAGEAFALAWKNEQEAIDPYACEELLAP